MINFIYLIISCVLTLGIWCSVVHFLNTLTMHPFCTSGKWKTTNLVSEVWGLGCSWQSPSSAGLVCALGLSFPLLPCYYLGCNYCILKSNTELFKKEIVDVCLLLGWVPWHQNWNNFIFHLFYHLLGEKLQNMESYIVTIDSLPCRGDSCCSAVFLD